MTAPLTIDTPHGPARATIEAPDGEAAGAIVLGHGAGGGIAARDLAAVAATGLAAGWAVARIEQPYRVAGRRAPAPARQLDAAWIAVLAALRAQGGPLAAGPLVTGGRSSGARVACRTAAQTGSAGVLCLAFPLHPPKRRGAARPSRLPELEAVTVPVLVVQGRSDPFGMPPAAPGREVVALPGTHSLTGDLDALGAAVAGWLARVGEARTGS